MSRSVEEVTKLTETTYKSVMDQFNPGLRNLVNLGKNYEKSAAAMILAGKLYFDAMSKIGENAAVSPVSRELGKFPCCRVLWLSTASTQGKSDCGNSFCFPEIIVYLTWVLKNIYCCFLGVAYIQYMSINGHSLVNFF
ncbi:hypothetical protein FQN60_003737 [Etheostoma spectabile]|uniref:IMD domain-containing protein n=1 Tax=Etheostoma spectabile TaxID=54343 RepID=A0A5J5CW13_9PERO|nr:hypothetical protein FQN60_003737 [Etheostoma spectabile]